MAHDSLDLARSGEQQERITIAFLVLAWFFISLRLWTRTFVISNFGWDDSTMILAGMIFTVYCAALLYIEANGGGTHVRSVEQLQLLTKWVVVSEATYVLAMMVLKISLGIFFARIIIKPWQFVLIYITVGVNIFSSAAAFFYCLFRCGPNLDKYVMQQLSNKCAPRPLDRFMAYQQAAFTTLTDIVFITLPIIIVWNANMDRKSKFSVGFILCLAALGCICSMIRFRYVDGLTQIDDFFWNAVNIAIWSTIEAGASIIAGCLATLRPFLKRVIVKARSSNSLAGCVKHITKSLRSGSRSNTSSNASSIPHFNTTASTDTNPKFESKPRDTADVRAIEEPTFVEFLSLPGEEVIALSSEIRQERKSTDPILGQRTQTPVDFPWLVQSNNREKNDTETRRLGSRILRRGIASDGVVRDRPISAPVPLRLNGQARDSVV
ncbi:hypothetical protein BKA66DRAFT_510809 [Pyrenochaeta sp. MPI-SDFR-AT-0127]|nr:hypothetical protein BKA66DRAFT_510809 [Pyrenochaeta sp. MPI-SDFR-AT-0127]